MRSFIAVGVGFGVVIALMGEPLLATGSYPRTTTNPDGSARRETPVVLKLKNTENNQPIPLAECNCKVVVYDANQNVVAQPQLESDVINGEPVVRSRILFPAPGAYTIVLTGSSKTRDFPPFTMKYPVNAR